MPKPSTPFTSASLPRVATGVLDQLYFPTDRQVTQRNESGYGVTGVYGNIHGAATSVQFRAAVNPGGRGVSTGWLFIANFQRSGTTFTGQIKLAQGGWYTLESRAVYGSMPGTVSSVAHLGVGEVFILAGQSNAVSSGTLDPVYRVSDLVSSFSGTRWAAATNPLPFDVGDGGSPFTYMANGLVRALGIPIGLVPVAWPGTTIKEWQPEAAPSWGRLERHFNDLVAALYACLSPSGVPGPCSGTRVSATTGRTRRPTRRCLPI